MLFYSFSLITKMKKLIVIYLITALLVSTSYAGLLAYGICQTGCNALAVACYGAAGFTFGTVTGGAAVPPVIAGCNVALGACMAGCVAAGAAPVP